MCCICDFRFQMDQKALVKYFQNMVCFESRKKVNAEERFAVLAEFRKVYSRKKFGKLSTAKAKQRIHGTAIFCIVLVTLLP